MGNSESLPKTSAKKGQSGSSSPKPINSKRIQRTKSAGANSRSLGEHDLDDIYHFVMELKQNKKEDVLEKFVLKQSAQLEGEDEIARKEYLAQVLGKTPLVAKSLEPPIKNIIIMNGSPKRTHRSKVSPSA